MCRKFTSDVDVECCTLHCYALQSKKMFKSLVFYLESCESGSMFANLIPKGTNLSFFRLSGPQHPSIHTLIPIRALRMRIASPRVA